MNEGARQANENMYRRRHLSKANATNEKLDKVIALLIELTKAHGFEIQTELNDAKNAPQPLRQVELWCDGGLRGPNPGSPLYGSYAFGDVKETVEFGVTGSNNEAEYKALIAGLDAVSEACDPGIVALTVKTDSQLVRLQILGEWRLRAENLRPLRDEAREKLARFSSWEIQHVPREAVVDVLGH